MPKITDTVLVAEADHEAVRTAGRIGIEGCCENIDVSCEAPLGRLVEVFAKENRPEVMHGILCDLLTPSELRDIALRWRLLELLEEGVPQRVIATDLGVSLCKITRGSKILKDPDSPLAFAVRSSIEI